LRDCAWLGRLLPELTTDLPAPPAPGALSVEAERRLMVEAVRRYLSNVAGPAGTLLLLDDLQWAGADALGLLGALCHGEAEQPVRVVGAYRDTEVQPHDPLAVAAADLAHAGLVAQRTLAPLTREETDQLLDGLLGAGDEAGPLLAGGSSLREQVARRAGGVPFFLVSCAQALRDRVEDGEDVVSVVPWNVSQGIRQRVAGLPAVAREVLGMAAVAGRVVPGHLLSGVVERSEVEVLEALDAVCRARLLEPAAATPHAGYAYQFVHDVIREVVERDLGPAWRAMLHRRIALAWECRPGPPPVEALAYHYAHTDDHDSAARWLEQAGDQAASRLALAAAADHYQAACAHLEESGSAPEALARLCEKLGDARWRRAEYAAAEESFALAQARATEPARRAALLHKEGLTWLLRGDHHNALAAFAMAAAERSAAGQAEVSPEQVLSALDLELALSGSALPQVEWHLWTGEPGVIEAALAQASAILRAHRIGRVRDLALAALEHWRGTSASPAATAGRLEESLRRVLAIREQGEDQEGSAEIRMALATLASQRGDPTQAEEGYRHALTIRERTGDQAGSVCCLLSLGQVYLAWGTMAQADEVHRRCLAIAGRLGDQWTMAECWMDLGDAAWNRGALAQAEEFFRQGLTMAERIGAQNNSAWGWNGQGYASLEQGDLRQAEGHFRRGLAIFERAHVPFGVAVARGNLGWVACARGDLPAAVRLCREARHMAQGPGYVYVAAHAAVIQAHAHLRGNPSGPRRRAARLLLDYARPRVTNPGWGRLGVRVPLLAAELALCQGLIAEARSEAEEVVRQARERGFGLDEAVARRLLGRCALAEGRAGEAEHHLRAALTMQMEMGAALEAARTRLALARALAAAGSGVIGDEARALVAEAQAQCAASGASLDLAQAEQLVAEWGIP
jgi:tetratricopeptide (TPR) repeat protein